MQAETEAQRLATEQRVRADSSGNHHVTVSDLDPDVAEVQERARAAAMARVAAARV